ncbi:hypothetical protein [Aureibaculum luteum]|uniref:hypothetical protein n=1 Tax=Aureibaculum luteum TaxID=1548456 RepID=UPI0013009C9D|nr:hypothetical protein [Aureibaculum luteum]
MLLKGKMVIGCPRWEKLCCAVIATRLDTTRAHAKTEKCRFEGPNDPERPKTEKCHFEAPYAPKSEKLALFMW